MIAAESMNKKLTSHDNHTWCKLRNVENEGKARVSLPKCSCEGWHVDFLVPLFQGWVGLKVLSGQELLRKRTHSKHVDTSAFNLQSSPLNALHQVLREETKEVEYVLSCSILLPNKSFEVIYFTIRYNFVWNPFSLSNIWV